MKLFKNFKTKRQLREEIARLEGMISVPREYTQLAVGSGEVKTLRVNRALDERILNLPVEVVKNEMCRELAKELEPVIEWETIDGTFGSEKIVQATLHVVRRR